MCVWGGGGGSQFPTPWPLRVRRRSGGGGVGGSDPPALVYIDQDFSVMVCIFFLFWIARMVSCDLCKKGL